MRLQIRLLCSLLLCAALVWEALYAAEESVRTPSDQMKEAVGKAAKAPASLGRSLQDLTDAAKERLRQTVGAKATAETKTMQEVVPVRSTQPVSPAPALKLDESQRDPFRPMTIRPKTEAPRKRENLSPLERHELSQLKLVGIVWDIGDPRAMVEDSGGLGYVIKVGTPIGNNEGRVKAIHRNEIVIEEFYSDDYGARKKRDVGMKLMTE
jgi:type IV pilus assembly protein PilP